MLENFFSEIDSKTVDEIKKNSKFKFFNRELDEVALIKAAQEWHLVKILEKEIPKQRINVLSIQTSKSRPKPYDHPALKDLTLTEDYLVNLNSFEINGSALIRNDFAFTLSPINESPNSSYWILRILIELSKSYEVYVRLDPFIYSRPDEFDNPQYKMWVHGIRNLDWQRISNLKSDDFGEWMPDNLQSSIDRTQFVWSAKSEEIHFACEEIPKINHANYKGSRYFHAIYNPNKDKIIHLDGALRIYNNSEIEIRSNQHLRNTGKVGKRVKIFRIDDNISRDLLSKICSNFFVWNNDVIQYFGNIT